MQQTAESTSPAFSDTYVTGCQPRRLIIDETRISYFGRR